MPLKIERLKQWCEDINSAQSDVKYNFIFVDEEGFEKFKPKNFEELIRNFTKYRTGMVAASSSWVDTILAKKEKGEDTTAEENKIDIMVYNLYELTYDEVKIIDPEIEKIISKEKYNTKSIEEIAK